MQKDEAQTEKTIANTTAENKEQYAAVYQLNVEPNGEAADLSAEVCVAEQIQNGEPQPISSTNENPEEVSPVAPAKQTVSATTAENKEEHNDNTFDQSNVEHNEAKVSADVHVEDPVAETSAVPAAELKTTEEPSTETEQANATLLEDATVQSVVQPAEGSCEKCPPEQSAEEIIEAVAEIAVESSIDTSDVVNATPGQEVALQDSVEAVAEVVTKSSSDTSYVVNATPGQEAALQTSVEPVPEFLAVSESEPPTQHAAETATEGNCENGPPEHAAEEIVEAVAEVAVESLSDTSDVVIATPGSEAALQDSVEAVAEVVVESSPETPAVTGAVVENAALQVSVDPVPDLVADSASEPPTQEAAETAIHPEESRVESAASAEPVLKAGAEEVVKCEVQPVDNPVVEQSVEPTSERAADHVVELTIKDAVEPATSLDAEAALDGFSDRLIELLDALDVEPPTTEAAPEPLKDPKQSRTETKLNGYSDDTNTSDLSQKSKEHPQSIQTKYKTRYSNVCSFCDKIIDGNVKIYLSEPVMSCHPDCLKCGVCAKALGDMLTPMFLHHQAVLCGGCFAEALKTEI
ncbi:fibrous sheath CABYR-binding protein [Anoplopoma fimbria]|uniref:fibrous sheath CABYR-binding protein n=1 Tax=Anoplopoma fimbria TaxID=229290 RepID=UPI0023EAA130|nr:fibrous sheath CABYR-binding protein [Anoplopoma fimbria]